MHGMPPASSTQAPGPHACLWLLNLGLAQDAVQCADRAACTTTRRPLTPGAAPSPPQTHTPHREKSTMLPPNPSVGGPWPTHQVVATRGEAADVHFWHVHLLRLPWYIARPQGKRIMSLRRGHIRGGTCGSAPTRVCVRRRMHAHTGSRCQKPASCQPSDCSPAPACHKSHLGIRVNALVHGAARGDLRPPGRGTRTGKQRSLVGATVWWQSGR